MTTSYTVPDDPKMLRETLCVAQWAIGHTETDRKREHVERLGRLINECDRHRPTGTDGKHGDRHTPTCGCEDVPDRHRPTQATLAIDRVTDVLIEHRDIVCVTGDPDAVAYDLLDHALSVEEMARALWQLWADDHAGMQVRPWDEKPDGTKWRYRREAAAIRAALLGADS